MIIVWILTGLGCGLLVNYIADVLPLTRRLSQPLWWPLNGKSGRKYLASPRVLIVFTITGLGAGYLYQSPPDFSIAALSAILVYFLTVAVIDIEHRVVLHPVSLAGMLILGAIGLWRHGLSSTLWGGLAGFGFMLLLYFMGEMLGRMIARKRGQKWEDTALGFGDVNLAGVIGLLIGWPGVIAALFVGMLAAGLFSGGYLLWMLVNRNYSAFRSIPYAPFLCFGAVFTVLLAI